MPETHAFLMRGRSFWPADPIAQQEVREPAPRHPVIYLCPRGHQFEVTFAAEHETGVEVPEEWECRRHGVMARNVDAPPAPAQPAKSPRTPWMMLCERRTPAQLEALLDERLNYLGRCRRTGVRPEPAPTGTKASVRR